MIFSNSLATQETLDRTLASVNMASAPETTAPFPPSKSKKSKKNRESANMENTVVPTSNNACAAQPVTRHLEFNQAMRDFKVMFPKMEWATIETVLRANNGAVDATIDQLLTLTEETPNTADPMAGAGAFQLDVAIQQSAQLGPATQHSQLGPTFTGHSPPPLVPTFTSHSPPPMYRGPIGEEQPPPYSPPSPTSPFSQMNRPVPKNLNTSAEDDSVFQEFMSTLQASPPSSIQSPAFTTTLSTAAPASVHRRRWNPPLVGELPDHFLRIPTISQTPENITDWWVDYNDYYGIMGIVTRCKTHCPIDCTCVLGNTTVTTNCNNGDIAETTIPYPSTNVSYLSWADSTLHTIKPDAFLMFGNVLKGLHLNNVSLQCIRPGVFNNELTSLRHLLIQDNDITNLAPDVFSELTSLLDLDLFNNNLTDLAPGVFSELTSMVDLDLFNNNLTDLAPGVFSELTSLEWLYLSDNHLTDLAPGVFSELTSLEWSYLSDNHLTDLAPGVFSELTSLTVLILDSNHLTKIIPGTFNGLFSELSNNSSSALEIVIALLLVNNNISILHTDTFQNQTALTHLDISNNQLRFLPQDIFHNLNQLQVLWLSGNNLVHIPADLFLHCVHLERLDLRDNPILWIEPNAFAGLNETADLIRRNVQQRSSVDKDDVEMQQMLNDERVALFMQNEEFMRELQHNPEFSEALELDVSEATREASLRNHRLSLSHQTHPSAIIQPIQIPIQRNVLSENDMTDGAVGGAVGGSVAAEDVVFRNKLKHMGKSTKVKFAQMARKFNSKKKKKSSRAGLEGASAPSTLNLIESEEEDDRTLLARRPRVEENIYSESNLI
ncbi:uncharacterized protein [Amphiura filiformis]|uniref:uncharacterized protein n=1 Tax=Amphiura filiformis TaxID=82378 RepID=UPI003B20CDA6